METHRDSFLGGITSGRILWILLLIGIMYLMITNIKKTMARGA